MCNKNKKILCKCNSVEKGQDYWMLEYHATMYPNNFGWVTTREEYRAKHKAENEKGKNIIGPIPIPGFEEMYRGITDKGTLWKVARAEEDWLNQSNPFDFEFEPVHGDRLTFKIGNQLISYNYLGGKWTFIPWQGYFTDDRINIDSESADEQSRKLAKKYLETGEAKPAHDPYKCRKNSPS